MIAPGNSSLVSNQVGTLWTASPRSGVSRLMTPACPASFRHDDGHGVIVNSAHPERNVFSAGEADCPQMKSRSMTSAPRRNSGTITFR
jgi:hypothetical protein